MATENIEIPSEEEQRSKFRKEFVPRLKSAVAHYTCGSAANNTSKRAAYTTGSHKLSRVPTYAENTGSPPYFTVIILIVCTVTYSVFNKGQDEQSTEEALLNSTWIVNGLQDWTQPWRFVTYSFLHGSLMHLINNMAILILVCPLLELRHSSIRPAGVYFMGCILGGMFSEIVSPTKFVVGASGGCYALVLAHTADMILNGDVMDKNSLWHRLVVWVTLAGFCLHDAYLLISDEGYPNLSHAAHVAGGFTGLFLGTFVLINYDEQAWEIKWQYVAFTIYVVAFVEVLVMSVMNIQRTIIDEDPDYIYEDESITAAISTGNMTVEI